MMENLVFYSFPAVPVVVLPPVLSVWTLRVYIQPPSGPLAPPSAPAASGHQQCFLESDLSLNASGYEYSRHASPTLSGTPKIQIQAKIINLGYGNSHFLITPSCSLRMCNNELILYNGMYWKGTLCLSIKLLTKSFSPPIGTSSATCGSALYSQSLSAWRASLNLPENSSASSNLCCLRILRHNLWQYFTLMVYINNLDLPCMSSYVDW